MPAPGLSLVGFMDQGQAIKYLRGACIPTDPSDAALITEWATAQTKLGAAFSDAGKPDIQEIHHSNNAYLQQLMLLPAVQQFLAANGAAFKVVEIDPLLAFQFHIMTDHSDGRCDGLKLGPGITDLLPICLPQVAPPETLRTSIHGIPDPANPNTVLPPTGSFVLVAETLNVQLINRGWDQQQNFVGVQFGIGLPFVQVARFNGRCYLTNGFHRAFGARKRGAGRMPCLFRDVNSPGELGIQAGGTFSLTLLESATPPTMAHFTQQRAHKVSIRKMTRVLQVSWSDHILAE